MASILNKLLEWNTIIFVQKITYRYCNTKYWNQIYPTCLENNFLNKFIVKHGMFEEENGLKWKLER